MEKVINLQKEGEEKVILLGRENITIGGGAVDSVNGMTGDVVLTTSDLENTSDYQTGAEVSTAINTAVAAETSAREAADTNLQSQIDGITASSDVTDIVGTYAELQAYDTSKLGDNDIIKVLQDESRNDETTYYRWDTQTQSFTLIGEEGPYYTKSQTDTLLNAKQNTLTAGTGIDITGDVISTTGGGGPTVVQTTGTSTTDVMSQNATTSMIYADPSAKTKININGTVSNVANTVSIGNYSSVSNSNGGVAIGISATINNGNRTIALGSSSSASGLNAVAFSSGNATQQGQFDVGVSESGGYNNTNYRLITGVHDPVDDHDAATKGYVDANAGGVKTLTTADYNFPSNAPTVIAPWLLPVGQYIVEPYTNVLPDGNSSQYNSGFRYGLLVFTQATSTDNGTFIISGNNLNGYYKVEYNGTPVTGFPHEL